MKSMATEAICSPSVIPGNLLPQNIISSVCLYLLSSLPQTVEILTLILSASWCGTSLVVDFEHASRGNQNPKSRLRH